MSLNRSLECFATKTARINDGFRRVGSRLKSFMTMVNVTRLDRGFRIMVSIGIDQDVIVFQWLVSARKIVLNC